MSMSRSPHKSRERIVTLAPPHFCEAKLLPYWSVQFLGSTRDLQELADTASPFRGTVVGRALLEGRVAFPASITARGASDHNLYQGVLQTIALHAAHHMSYRS